MKGDLFTIGEMAKLSGITVKALRFYERIGLFAPHLTDPDTKYRYYSKGQFFKLDIVKAARTMGMSLLEIKSLLEAKDVGALLESLERQGRQTEERIAELRRTASSMEAARAAIAYSSSSIGESGVYYKEIPERRIVSRKIGASPSIEGIVIEYSSLERIIRERRLINRYETGILFALDEESRYRASEVFNSVGIDADSDSKGLSLLPSGKYLCVRYDEKNAVMQQAKLNAHLRRRRLEPTLILQADMLSDMISAGAERVELQVLFRESGRKG
jgi:MerR family transcriptional regulator, activator of bmr gene